MRSTAGALFGSSEQTSQRAESAVQRVQRGLRQCGDRRRRRRRIVPLDRRDQPPARTIDQRSSHWRPRRRSATDGQIAGLAAGGAEDRRRGQADPRHRRADQSAGAQRHHRGGARRAKPARDSRWWRRRSNRWRCRPPRRPRTSPVTSSRCRISTAGAVEAIRQIAARMQEINHTLPAVRPRSSSRTRRPGKSRTTSPAPRKAPIRWSQCSTRWRTRRRRRAASAQTVREVSQTVEAAVAESARRSRGFPRQGGGVTDAVTPAKAGDPVITAQTDKYWVPAGSCHRAALCAGPVAGTTAGSPYAWLAAVLPRAACAAASRAIGTRNGEHDT